MSAKKLKVLHLTSHLDVGGISRYIQLLGTMMIQRGHRVDVASGGGALEGEFEQGGMKTYRFEIRKKSILSPALYFPLSRIAGLIRNENYDVIHAHTRVTQALSFFLRRMTGVPTVSTYHGFFKYNFGRKAFPFWADRIVAISAPVAEELQSLHHAPPARIRVVGNAIDIQKSELRLSQKNSKIIRLKYGISEKAIVVSSIARLVQDKGHEILIRAMAELLPSFPDIFILMAGDGREKANLERLIAELKLEGHAALVPSVLDISEILAVTDIFAHPAFYREGFGLAIAEAMAARKPVVITNISAINQLFRPGECSVMAEPADVRALAGAIRFLMEAPAESARIAEAGHRLVQTLCSVERQSDEMEAVYRELLSQ